MALVAARLRLDQNPVRERDRCQGPHPDRSQALARDPVWGRVRCRESAAVARYFSFANHAASARPILRILSEKREREAGTLASQGSSTPINASAAPASARFFINEIMLLLRSAGSSLRQKSCMIGDTPARNPKIAIAPIFGLTPSNRLVPPAMSGTAVAVTASSGAGTPFVAV